MSSEKCPVCGNPADKLCSACRSVSYCCAKHQKQHWKLEHKHNCKIWTVGQNDVLGRYVIAARDISPGTVIMQDECLAMGPQLTTLPVCLTCYARVDGNYVCSMCAFPMCGKKCESDERHAEQECKFFRGNQKLSQDQIDIRQHHPVYECILPLRCFLLKDRNPRKWQRLNTMEHHNQLREGSQQWNRNEVNVVQYLRDNSEVKVDARVFHTIMGILLVNCFEVRKENTQTAQSSTVGAVYADVALMNHDCVPNTCHFVGENDKMVVRASVPIKKGDKITTSYAHTLNGTMSRRKFLKISKLFDCTCARCESGTELDTHFSSVVCQSCSKGYLLPRDPLDSGSEWLCNMKNCGCTMPSEAIELLVNGIKRNVEMAQRGPRCVERLEEIVKTCGHRVLHPNHYVLFGAKMVLSQMYGKVQGWSKTDMSLDSWRRKEELCRDLLSIVDKLEPGLSRIRGSTLFELQFAAFVRVCGEHQSKSISQLEMKHTLMEVLELLNTSLQILSFDQPTSFSGRLAKTIPGRIAEVKSVLKKFCSVDVDSA